MTTTAQQSSVSAEVLTIPFTVVIDTREQLPFSFAGLRADARQGRKLLAIPLATGTLSSGDYSIAGHEGRIVIERKSLTDAFQSFGSERRRFERELARLSCYEFSAVVIEADWSAIIHTPPERSQLDPKTIFRSVITWQQRYPGTHWWACPDRRFAEVATFRMLERFWRDRVEGGQQPSGSLGTYLGRLRGKELLAEMEGDALDLSDVSE